MQLAQLLAGVPNVTAVTGSIVTPVTKIVFDSRQVTPGALFVAYRGIGLDGHRFIPEALALGAAVVVGELPAANVAVPVTYVQVADGRAALAWLAAAWYGHPSRTMTLVGITGTDGKTTTANLLFSILRAAGIRAGLISTVNAVIGGEEYDTGLHTTTPDAPDVQRYLAQMRDAGTEIAVLEVTSHGLVQHRVTGCAFDIAVVTNITHEHLDIHGSYEEYRAAKALLFRSLSGEPCAPGNPFPKPGAWSTLPKTAVLNRDDSSYGHLSAILVPRTMSYGLVCPPSENRGNTALTAVNIRHMEASTEFDVQIDPGSADLTGGTLSLVTSLVGDFNVSNILASIAAALALGVDHASIQTGIQAMKGVPGRMERIDAGQEFLALVDFAHTPNALTRALNAAHTLVQPGGRVLVVFGCAGLRDRAKRRMMGEVAARLADYTVVTAEDPRTEDLAAIMAETASELMIHGRGEGRDFVCIPDRQRAILHAVEHAAPGDVLMVCGKGHELSMCFGSKEYPWRDQDALRWALLIARAQGDASAPPSILPTWFLS